MELWIRSQDKKILTKFNNVWINDNQIWMEVPFYENHKKIGLSITGCNHKLGQYKSKERALEVLDEIQKILIPKYILNTKSIRQNDSWEENGIIYINCNADANIERFDTYVYQMPKE